METPDVYRNIYSNNKSFIKNNCLGFVLNPHIIEALVISIILIICLQTKLWEDVTL